MTYVLIFLGIVLLLSSIMFVYRPFKKDNFECKHAWGPIDNGYQYCNFCGLAKKTECIHEWELERESVIVRNSDNSHIGNTQIYKCNKCTVRKYIRMELGHDPVSKII